MPSRAQHDTTELKRLVFQRTLEAVVVATPDGAIVQHNPAAETIFGWADLPVHGWNWVDLLLPPAERTGFVERLKNQAEDVSELRLELLRADGSAFPAELTIQPCETNGERLLTLFARDVTEQVRVDRLKSEFVSTVSHELRTPLTSISGSLSLLLGGIAGELPDAARQMVEIALNNSKRLVRLINDILDIEKIESGRMDFRREQQPLVPILEQALQVNQGYAEEHDVQFTLVVAPEIVNGEVNADRDRLLQVLTNLISNAAKYSPPRGTVELRATPRGSQVRVSVHDQGGGIPEAFHDQIFQKFAQADSSATRQVGGTGLGLSICKAIVEQHGGTIDFRTGSEGTTFHFDLALVGLETPSTSTLTDGPQQHHLLIIEDDEEIAHLVQMVLRAAGHTGETCSTLSAARDRLATRPFDAVVLDLSLPDGNGIELLTELAGSIPAVILSSSAPLPLPNHELRIVSQVAKPFTKPQLLAAVSEALRADDQDLPRILHVEDDPDIRRVVSLLVGSRAEIVPVGGCCDALWQLETEAFDLVLLDIDLPDGSGRDLIGHIRAPVIVFSAHEIASSACVASFVKSRTSNAQLLDAIEAQLQLLPGGAT